MTPFERLYTAISGGLADRIPAVPKITVHCASRISGRPMRELLADPVEALRVVIDTAISVRADAARLLQLPPRRLAEQDGELIELDDAGQPLGVVDAAGGLATRLFDARRFHIEDHCHVAWAQFRASPEPYVRSVEQAKSIAVPSRQLYAQFGWDRSQRAMLAEAGDRIALIGDCNTATLAFNIYFRGYQNSLLDLVDNPRLAHALMEKGVECAIERGKFHVDCGLKILRLNDSAGNISVISPRHWREFIGPHMKTVCEELHRYSPDVRIYCHICGNVMPVLDDLIATGLDCIGPLDPLGGFTARQARERCGDRVALMGGVNAVTFARGTPDDIVAEARACIEGAGPRGYVLGSGCMVPPDARRENLEALADAVSC